jgi:hypothetical protein
MARFHEIVRGHSVPIDPVNRAEAALSYAKHGIPSPEQPALAPILALHRHDDGYIAFAVARDGDDDFRPLISIRRDELARYCPGFRDQLLKDAYVSINAGWRLQRYGTAGAAYGHPSHRTDRLRYLCAAYVDLDYYRLGVNWGQALGKVVDMQEAGVLPKASIIVKSGRGMWLLYLLHDHRDPSRAPRAFPEKLEQYFALQRAIIQRLAFLGADAGASDAVRHIRLPGSLHTGAESRVSWWIQGGRGGLQLFAHSIVPAVRRAAHQAALPRTGCTRGAREGKAPPRVGRAQSA